MNWARGKKIFVAFKIRPLTFGVCIGSAIYFPGIISLVATGVVYRQIWPVCAAYLWTVELMCLSGFTLVLIFFHLPETRLTKSLPSDPSPAQLTRNDELRCAAEIMAEQMKLKDNFLVLSSSVKMWRLLVRILHIEA